METNYFSPNPSQRLSGVIQTNVQNLNLKFISLDSSYKVRYRNSEDGSKTEEIVVIPGLEDQTNNVVSLRLSGLAIKDVYKINISSVVEDAVGAVIESKALHEKLILQTDGTFSIYKEEERDQR